VPLRTGQFLPRWPTRPTWGARYVQVQASPAAGADWRYTVLGGRVVRVAAVHATLTTSAQVASRYVGATMTDGNNTFARTIAGPAISAGKTAEATWMPSIAGDVSEATELVQMVAFPDVLLPVGWTLAARTLNLQTEDQWSAVSLLIEEFETTVPHEWDDIEAMAASLRRIETGDRFNG
jgi:hypothetical protein